MATYYLSIPIYGKGDAIIVSLTSETVADAREEAGPCQQFAAAQPGLSGVGLRSVSARLARRHWAAPRKTG